MAALLRLGPVLRAQFGVFTTGDARRRGVTSADISRLITRGLAVRLWRGVYAVTSVPDSPDLRWYAAMRAAGPTAAVSHRAAAYLHGLRHVGAGRRPELELVRPGEQHRRTSGPVTRTAKHLRPTDVIDLVPWRVTSLPWTLCSLAHRLGADAWERAIEAAIADGLVTLERLRSVGARFACCPGAPVIRAVLVDPLDARGTRSEAERSFLRLLRRAGLPLPEADVRVEDDAGRVRYLDFAYRDARIAIEIDVHPDHEGTLGRRRDGARQNDLVSRWLVLRFDARDLSAAATQVVGQVSRVLAARSMTGDVTG